MKCLWQLCVSHYMKSLCLCAKHKTCIFARSVSSHHRTPVSKPIVHCQLQCFYFHRFLFPSWCRVPSCLKKGETQAGMKRGETRHRHTDAHGDVGSGGTAPTIAPPGTPALASQSLQEVLYKQSQAGNSPARKLQSSYSDPSFVNSGSDSEETFPTLFSLVTHR